MAFTTLLSVLVMGAAAGRQQVQIAIEAKVYSVTSETFKLEGSSVKFSKPDKDRPDLQIGTVTGIDERKLREDKGFKLVTAPVIRTLNGLKAEMTTTLAGFDKKSEKSTLAFVPVLRQDAMFDLSITLSYDRDSEPKESWVHAVKPRLQSDQPYAILVSSPLRKNLFVFKTYLVNQ